MRRRESLQAGPGWAGLYIKSDELYDDDDRVGVCAVFGIPSAVSAFRRGVAAGRANPDSRFFFLRKRETGRRIQSFIHNVCVLCMERLCVYFKKEKLFSPSHFNCLSMNTRSIFGRSLARSVARYPYYISLNTKFPANGFYVHD